MWLLCNFLAFPVIPSRFIGFPIKKLYNVMLYKPVFLYGFNKNAKNGFPFLRGCAIMFQRLQIHYNPAATPPGDDNKTISKYAFQKGA